MNLTDYFQSLLTKVEASPEISNAGKDKDGFYFPTRSALLQKLNMLKDLNQNERAKPMLKSAWSYVVEILPPEWLVMSAEEKAAVKKMLS
jgi:hypothetical protein